MLEKREAARAHYVIASIIIIIITLNNGAECFTLFSDDLSCAIQIDQKETETVHWQMKEQKPCLEKLISDI